jgi:hypothetical protein
MRRTIALVGALGVIFLLGQIENGHSSESSDRKNWNWSWKHIQGETSSTEDGKPMVVGSGLNGKETRKLPPFDKISVHGSVNVAVEVTPGPATADIDADDNLVPKIRTKVEGDVLTIDVDGSYRTRHPMIVRVHSPALTAASSEGSSDLQISGVNAKSLKLVTSGSGDIKASGKAQAIEYVVNGSGDIEAEELDASQGVATVNGSGNIELHVRDKLTATVNGSGNIGSGLHPTTLVSQIHGSGDIDL